MSWRRTAQWWRCPRPAARPQAHGSRSLGGLREEGAILGLASGTSAFEAARDGSMGKGVWKEDSASSIPQSGVSARRPGWGRTHRTGAGHPQGLRAPLQAPSVWGPTPSEVAQDSLPSGPRVAQTEQSLSVPPTQPARVKNGRPGSTRVRKGAPASTGSLNGLGPEQHPQDKGLGHVHPPRVPSWLMDAFRQPRLAGASLVHFSVTPQHLPELPLVSAPALP